MMNWANLIAAAVVGAAACASTPSEPLEAAKVALTDDVSRSELLQYANSLELGAKAFPRTFYLPEDVVDRGLFGIDVSHHQGQIDWDKALSDTKIAFVYMKATQGTRFYDKQFAPNWQALEDRQYGNEKIRRGAYHFFSAGADAASQADNFISIVGALGVEDLPACLDLEWDFARANGAYVLDENGNMVDRWSNLDADEIIAKAKTWLELVEQSTGRKPIIYTNATWWKERIGDRQDLAGYTLWVSDYSRGSLKTEVPRSPEGYEWRLWQLTDTGRIPDANLSPLDVNVFAGSAGDFREWCCGIIERAQANHQYRGGMVE